MDSSLAVRIRNHVLVAWKYAASFTKHDWAIRDYPIGICEFKPEPRTRESRLKPYRFVARVINWPGMSGGGETAAQALQELQSNFEKLKSKRSLPRPGTGLPIKFASRERITRHPQLVDDFVSRILNVECIYLSDESTLWDFHEKPSNGEFYSKIKRILRCRCV